MVALECLVQRLLGPLMRNLAAQAGLSQASFLLNQTLLEEERADKIMSRIAMKRMEDVSVGPDAVAGDEKEETKEVVESKQKRSTRR